MSSLFYFSGEDQVDYNAILFKAVAYIFFMQKIVIQDCIIAVQAV